MLFAVGTVLAVAKPGDLGDDDSVASDTTTSTTLEVTTSTTEPVTTTSGSGATSTTQVGGAGGTTTTAPASTTTTRATSTTGATTSTTVPATTSTTSPSGLGSSDAGTPNPDGVISDTGGESYLGLGLGLLGVGLVLRRATRRAA